MFTLIFNSGRGRKLFVEKMDYFMAGFGGKITLFEIANWKKTRETFLSNFSQGKFCLMQMDKCCYGAFFKKTNKWSLQYIVGIGLYS